MAQSSKQLCGREVVWGMLPKRVVIRGGYHEGIFFYGAFELNGIMMLVSYSVYGAPALLEPRLDFEVCEYDDFGAQDGWGEELMTHEDLWGSGTASDKQVFFLASGGRSTDDLVVEPPGSTRLRDALVRAHVLLGLALARGELREVEIEQVQLFDLMYQRIRAFLKEMLVIRENALKTLLTAEDMKPEV